jgi:Hydrazine synthase alpha subunit middle domain
MLSKMGGPALWGCIGLVCLAGFILAGTSPSATTYLFTEASHYSPRAWLANGERFPAGATIRVVSAGGRRSLVNGFAASADPDLSFDAARVLFAGKQKTGDPWRIWEVALERGTPRQISGGDGDCYRPLYLPGDQIVYTRRTPVGSQIEIASIDGGTPERLTFAPGHFLTADVLRDGRVLFEAERLYAGRTVREIMSVYPDGTGVESIRCDHGADRHSPKELASGDIVFVEGGRLARFTSALAHETAVVPQPAGEAAGPVADGGPGELIFAARQHAQQPFRISLLPAAAHSAGMNELQPVIVASRIVPRRFPSALLATRTAGNLLCLNAATSRDPIRGGAIRAMRVYTQDDAGKQALLGTQAVEKDGSFFVQVPGDKPLRLEALDGAGRVVSAERNWWWMRVAEQRGCVGCHAGPERAPDNELPQVLLRKDVPVPMLKPAVQQGSKGY